LKDSYGFPAQAEHVLEAITICHLVKSLKEMSVRSGMSVGFKSGTGTSRIVTIIRIRTQWGLVQANWQETSLTIAGVPVAKQ